MGGGVLPWIYELSMGSIATKSKTKTHRVKNMHGDHLFLRWYGMLGVLYNVSDITRLPSGYGVRGWCFLKGIIFVIKVSSTHKGVTALPTRSLSQHMGYHNVFCNFPMWVQRWCTCQGFIKSTKHEGCCRLQKLILPTVVFDEPLVGIMVPSECFMMFFVTSFGFAN